MKLSQQRTQLWILFAALLVSLAVYAVIAVVVKPPVVTVDGRPPPAEADPAAPVAAADPGLFLPLFAGIAAVELFVVLPILRRRMMPRRAPSPHPLDAAVEDVEDPRIDEALARLRTISIVSWALAESVALFGLVAAFVLREPRYYAPFAAVAAVVMLVYAPRRRVIDEVVRAARGG